MAYCTLAQLKARKGEAKIAQLTGDPAGATIDEATVNEVIDDFSEKMDASIRKQYPDLPFDDTNKYLRGLNIEGAYLLLERDSERGWTDDYRADWKLLEAQLSDIARGIQDLRTETEAELETMTDGYFSTGSRLFGRNSLSPEV